MDQTWAGQVVVQLCSQFWHCVHALRADMTARLPPDTAPPFRVASALEYALALSARAPLYPAHSADENLSASRLPLLFRQRPDKHPDPLAHYHGPPMEGHPAPSHPTGERINARHLQSLPDVAEAHILKVDRSDPQCEMLRPAVPVLSTFEYELPGTRMLRRRPEIHP